jgi:hypothetical protein
MSDKQDAFFMKSKPSTKQAFDAQAEKLREAQKVFFADIEKRRNNDKKQK